MQVTNKNEIKSVELSIVTTMYYSAIFIAEFVKRSSDAARKLNLSYEIVLVNDGSPDDSIDKARALFENDDHVRVIDLARNFGHHRAIMVGLEYSRGHHVFLIDCDLEEDPTSILDFFAELRNTNADVVYGVLDVRKGSFVKNIGGAIFWKLFNLLSNVAVNPKVITSRLMTRRYVNALLGFREQELFLAGIFALTGFDQRTLIVKKEARSETTYTIKRRFDLLVNAITSFSSRPLVLVFYIGLAISTVSGITATALIARKLLFDDFQMGWSSLIVSIWLIGGITIFCIGLIGIYLSKVFHEVKSRPLSIVRAIYERSPHQ